MKENDEQIKYPVARTRLANGVSLSIQGSQTHYCTPKTNDCSLYSHYEIGYIEDKDGKVVTPPKSWKQYADCGDFPSDVYANVPVETILYFINEVCGGWAND
jgi:hypothetical protein